MRSDDMTFFHEGTMRICGSLDIDEVLRDCLAFIKKYMLAEGIQLCIYEEKFRGIRVVSMASDMELREFDRIIPLSNLAIEYIEKAKDMINQIERSFDN